MASASLGVLMAKGVPLGAVSSGGACCASSGLAAAKARNLRRECALMSIILSFLDKLTDKDPSFSFVPTSEYFTFQRQLVDNIPSLRVLCVRFLTRRLWMPITLALAS